MKKISFLVLLSFFVLAGTAQNLAYVNTQMILSEMPEVKQANSNLETFRNQLINLGQMRIEAFQKKYQELELKQQRGELSPKQLEEETAKLKKDEEEIMRFEQDSQRRIREKNEELFQPILKKVQDAIDEVAKEEGYAYVFDSGSGFILYADESTDITAKVLEKMKAKK
jgi:outer membrane protein